MAKFDYVNVAQEMVDRDTQRDIMFKAMEDMFHNQWNLPTNLSSLDWVRKVVSTDPHDAVQAGVRMFATREPAIKYIPPWDNPETKKHGQVVEKFLKFWLNGASKRRRATIVQDLVRSALLYDMVVAQVVSLKYQQKLVKQIGLGEQRRWDQAKEYGPFTVIVYKPLYTHVTVSDLGLERIYTVQKETKEAVKAFWGRKAKGVDGFESDDKYCYVHDMLDYDRRVVWVTGDSEPGNGFELMDEPNSLGFINWAVRVGGTTLEDESEFQYKPLLESIYRAGQWETQNVVETLWISDVIARAAQPRGIKEGPNPDKIEKDYAEPGGDILVPPGHKYTPNPPEPLDANLMTVGDRIQNAVTKSTVPKVVMGGDLPANTQFATVNLVTQTAVNSLMPYKRLAELAIVDICSIMVKWFLEVGSTEMMPGMAKEDLGHVYSLEPAMFAAEDPLYLECELTADVPTDRIQRINAANLARQTLGYSQVSALEDIGVNDPDKEIRMSSFEQLFNAKLQAQVKLELAQADLQIQEAQMKLQMQAQQAQMQMQLQMQQQQMAAQAQMQQQQQAASQQEETQNAQQLINETPQSGVEGQGFNPAMGGTPPAEANPEATFEGQTGQSRGGQDVVPA